MRFLASVRHILPVLLSAALALGAAASAHADSPITETPFHKAYAGDPMVAHAAALGALDDRIADFLLDARQPVGLRLAVVNAMGWGEARDRHSRYLSRATLRRGRPAETAEGLPWQVQLVAGYMMAMDDHRDPMPGLRMVETAQARSGGSRAAMAILSLLRAQAAMLVGPEAPQAGFCRSWLAYSAGMLDDDRSAVDDFPPAAAEILDRYMFLFPGYCGLDVHEAANAWGDARGYAWASANLAELYYFGTEDRAADFARALPFARRAAAAGNRKGLWIEGMVRLHAGMERDDLPDAAVGHDRLENFLRGADWDEADAFNPRRRLMEGQARYALAVGLYFGRFVTRDMARAERLAREAQALGYPLADALLREIAAGPPS